MNHATFIISTGRCGTQWLAEVLRRAAGNDTVVTHEPLGADYAAREMLAARSPENLDPALAAPLFEHVAGIEETLASSHYIECGHPLWSSLPWLLERFAGRVRVVHLVRHPVPTAYSWLTLRAYCPPLAPHLSERVPLSPFDEGATFTTFRKRWPALTPYEKALYYWTELNAFALRLQEVAGVSWLTLRIEDLFRGQGIAGLFEFVGASAASASDPRDVKPIDEFHYFTDCYEPELIERHPEVLTLARTLGYDPFDFDRAALLRRYVRTRPGNSA